MDRSAAYEEFKRLFADDPAMLNEASPTSLPASFRVWSSSGQAPIELRTLPGVREITTC